MLLSKSRAAGYGLLFCLVTGLAGPANWASAQAGSGEGPSNDGAFLSTLEDVPLMPGLIEIAGAGMVFDKPDGRIAETFAEGALVAGAVRRFYEDSLPQLGWRPLSKQPPSKKQGGAAQANMVFERDNERLSIGVTGKDGALRVRFALSPN